MCNKAPQNLVARNTKSLVFSNECWLGFVWHPLWSQPDSAAFQTPTSHPRLAHISRALAEMAGMAGLVQMMEECPQQEKGKPQ